jgi:Flp pilus assembly protein TadG
MSLFRRERTSRQGATAVEFAVVAPILFLVVLGIFEYGRAFMVQQLLTDAARAGCRLAILPNQSNSTVDTLISSTLTAEGISGTTTQITVNGSGTDVGSANSGDVISVQLSVPITSITVVPKGYLSGSLVAQASLRRE